MSSTNDHTEATRLAKELSERQGAYQPFYGLKGFDEGERANLLRRNCGFVSEFFKEVKRKQQVQIVDVGCNAGFTTLTLAETFPSITGLEISDKHLKLSQALAKLAQSQARFRGDDLFAKLERDDANLEAVDCVLLFNVMHQIIFKFGMAYAQMMLARIASSVDVVFIELAQKHEYERHGLAHMLPVDPYEIFSACSGIEITLLAHLPRPLYRLQRRTVRFDHIALDQPIVEFSDNQQPWISRKYYRTDSKFLKVYRFNEKQPPRIIRAELAALLKMQGSGVVPKLLDWRITDKFGALLTENVEGQTLLNAISRIGDQSERESLADQVLSITKIVTETIGFHNDISLHNLMYRPGRPLILVDFEQTTGDQPKLDPFAALLWTTYDILSGSPHSYKADIYRKLVPSEGSERADLLCYPPASENLGTKYSSLREAAMKANGWKAFISSRSWK